VVSTPILGNFKVLAKIGGRRGMDRSQMDHMGIPKVSICGGQFGSVIPEPS
jgi:hypothetical protein